MAKMKENVGQQALYCRRVKNKENNPNNVNYTPLSTKKDIIEDNKLTVFRACPEYDKRQYFVYQERPTGPAICRITCKKFPKEKHRYYVSFWDYKRNKYRYYPLSKVIYLFFVGDIPEGYVVDHINNNSLDNSVNNLQLLTRAENTRKSNKLKIFEKLLENA